METNLVWRLAESFVFREKQSFCLKEISATRPVNILANIDPAVPDDAVRKALDLAEDLSEDAIEHHKNEITRLQSNLKALRSFRSDDKTIAAIVNGCG